MATSSRIHALKNAITDGLLARPGLSGVQVASAYLGDESDAREWIQLIGEDPISAEWAQIGKFSRDETITLVGAVWTLKPGKGETVIRSARQRAQELLAEVEGLIVADPSIGGVVKQTKIRPVQLNEGADGNGRWAMLAFEIEALSRLTSS